METDKSVRIMNESICVELPLAEIRQRTAHKYQYVNMLKTKESKINSQSKKLKK